ncbi:MAG: serine hydrolase [Deinococcota bacterium]
MIERYLEQFIQKQMIATRMPGLSLVLIRGDEVAQRHFGFRDLTTRQPPTGHTRYGLGSVTKVFTALAIMQLVQEGALELDHTLTHYLPLEAHALGDATIRHVLAHSSGLPALGWSETKMSSHWFMDGFPIGGYEDLATFMHGADAWRTAEPGERWQYSNEGYILLGRLIESLDGRPYTQALTARLLEPLGMTRSTFSQAVVTSDDDRVQPYMARDDGTLMPGSNLYGAMPAAGGLVSTADDMTALANLLLGKGTLPDGQSLVSADLIGAMAQPDVKIDPATPFDTMPLWSDATRFNGAGLQLHPRALFGHDVWGYGGGVMGGTSYVMVAPDVDVGVVILANAHGYPLAQLSLVALASLLGQTPDAMPFVQRQQLVERSAGSYASWSNTIRADLLPRAWGVELRMAFEPKARTIPLVLLSHDTDADVTSFLALGSGRPGIANIVRQDDSTLELRYERYVLRQQGKTHL